MNIEKKIEMYLGEATEKDALAKVIAVIKSSKTEEQLKMAVRMSWNFINMYGAGFWAEMDHELTSLPMGGEKVKKFRDLIDFQKDKIGHIEKQKV